MNTCPKAKLLAGSWMCACHGLAHKSRLTPAHKVSRPSGIAVNGTSTSRPHWSSENRFHDGLTKREAEDAQLAGLVRALRNIERFLVA